MNDESGCATQVLAAGPVCRVERCDHGTIHVTLGVLTLRLTARQLEEIAATLDRATERLGVATLDASARMLC